MVILGYMSLFDILMIASVKAWNAHSVWKVTKYHTTLKLKQMRSHCQLLKLSHYLTTVCSEVEPLYCLGTGLISEASSL